MKILGIESSSLVASVAVVTDQVMTAEYTVNFKKTHSQTLLPMLDQVAEMIDLAGGTYVPQGLTENENALSTMNMQMEEFYAQAKDADYLVYNSTIDGNLASIDDLLAKNSLFADFKAVQNGNVWCIGKNLYQDTMDTGSIIHDFHEMLNSEDTDELTYMYKLK